MKQHLCCLLVFILSFNTLLPILNPADLCSCDMLPGGPSSEFVQADAVFTGRISTISTQLRIPYISPLLARLLPDVYGYHPLFKRLISFDITQSWKGVTTTQTVLSPWHDCDFEVGKEYLIYAHKIQGKWITFACDTNALVAGPFATDDFAFLATQPTLPLTTPFPWFTLCFAILLLTLTIALGAFWYTWRKRKAAYP